MITLKDTKLEIAMIIQCLATSTSHVFGGFEETFQKQPACNNLYNSTKRAMKKKALKGSPLHLSLLA